MSHLEGKLLPSIFILHTIETLLDVVALFLGKDW